MIAHIPVQLATRNHAAQIAAMSRDLIEHGLPWGWTESRVARAITATDTNVVVVEEQQRVVGFGIMSYTDQDAHLLLLAVLPHRRRSGIARAIVHWLEEAARAGGAARVRVEARLPNDAARNFYSELGYHERTIERGMYAGSVNGVRLEKWLRRDE